MSSIRTFPGFWFFPTSSTWDWHANLPIEVLIMLVQGIIIGGRGGRHIHALACGNFFWHNHAHFPDHTLLDKLHPLDDISNDLCIVNGHAYHLSIHVQQKLYQL